MSVLSQVGKILKNQKNRMIVIEGHTDSEPIQTVRFPSNWELSAARAISVLNFFVNIIVFCF